MSIHTLQSRQKPCSSAAHRDAGALVALRLHPAVQCARRLARAHKDDGLPELFAVGEDHLLQHPRLGIAVGAPAQDTKGPVRHVRVGETQKGR